MKKILIVYYSQSGNTEMMAEAVGKGIKESGNEVNLISVSEADHINPADYDAFAFGSPAMGNENLEESEFQPFWDNIKAELGKKKVLLFGSYGWGSGEWMESWVNEAKENKINLINDGIIANYAPDDDVLLKLEESGKELVQ